MKTPTKVKIGSQTFKVVERSRHEDGMLNDDTFGYTLDVENLIVLDSSIALSRKKLTLFHELMHATRMVYDTSITPKKSDTLETWEHYFIGIWEESLLVLLRDNPALLAWLIEEETEDADNGTGTSKNKRATANNPARGVDGGSRNVQGK